MGDSAVEGNNRLRSPTTFDCSLAVTLERLAAVAVTQAVYANETCSYGTSIVALDQRVSPSSADPARRAHIAPIRRA